LFFERDAFEEEGGGFMKKERLRTKTKVSKKNKTLEKTREKNFVFTKLLFFTPKTV